MEKIYIFMTRQNYGEQLARFLAGKHTVEVELLTDIKEKTEFEEEDFILSDAWENIPEMNCHVVRMVGRPERVQENAVFMYQSKENVYRDILKLTKSGKKGEAEKGNRIIGVFSPEGGDEKTLLALQTAAEQAKKTRVLYISFSGFPVLLNASLKPEEGDSHGLSELMLSGAGSVFEGKLEELAFELEQIWILKPVKHFKDLLDFSTEDVKNFMRGLKTQTKFDTVVVEMGQMFEYTLDLLECADEVILPKENGFFAQIKRHVLGEYCRMEQHESLWKRMRFETVSGQIPADEEALRSILRGEGGGG